MSIKETGPADLRIAGRFDGGLTWIAHPDEAMRRASHALVGDGGGVWVVDPVDAPDLDDHLAELGEVAGVVVLLDRHKRDAAAVARRHDVPVYLPRTMDGVASDLDAPTERFGDELAGSGFRARTVLDNRVWQETALYREPTLVVPEAVGTAPFLRTGGERLGVHPALRAFPPRRALGEFAPERVLVGHGDPVETGGATALADALAGSRRRLPRLYARIVGELVT